MNEGREILRENIHTCDKRREIVIILYKMYILSSKIKLYNSLKLKLACVFTSGVISRVVNVMIDYNLCSQYKS
jgi:hypothetical protein